MLPGPPGGSLAAVPHLNREGGEGFARGARNRGVIISLGPRGPVPRMASAGLGFQGFFFRSTSYLGFCPLGLLLVIALPGLVGSGGGSQQDHSGGSQAAAQRAEGQQVHRAAAEGDKAGEGAAAAAAALKPEELPRDGAPAEGAAAAAAAPPPPPPRRRLAQALPWLAAGLPAGGKKPAGAADIRAGLLPASVFSRP